MRHSRAAAACAALLLSILPGGCSQASEKDSESRVSGTLQEREPTRVRVEAVERREMVRRLSTTTEVASEQEVLVFPLSSGVVTEIRVEEGDRVHAGDVLAVLDRREAELTLADASVGLQEARDAVETAALAVKEAEGRTEAQRLVHETASHKYDRNQKAALVSEQGLDELEHERDKAERNWQNARLEIERAEFQHECLQTGVDRARLTHERAQLALSFTEIAAPFDGVIAERTIYVGDNAGPATAAFRLTDDLHLRAIIYRPQRELALFAADRLDTDGPASRGIRIEATAEALPGYRFRGDIQRISPGIDPASGAFRVTVALNEATDGTRLLPGMLLRLEIVVERHADALVVPKRALRREGDTTILFRVRDGVVQRLIVDEGFDDDLGVEVLPRAGFELAPGDAIVVVGNRDLEDGEQVAMDHDSGPWPAAHEPPDPAVDVSELARQDDQPDAAEQGTEPRAEPADGSGTEADIEGSH